MVLAVLRSYLLPYSVSVWRFFFQAMVTGSILGITLEILRKIF